MANLAQLLAAKKAKEESNDGGTVSTGTSASNGTAGSDSRNAGAGNDSAAPDVVPAAPESALPAAKTPAAGVLRFGAKKQPVEGGSDVNPPAAQTAVAARFARAGGGTPVSERDDGKVDSAGADAPIGSVADLADSTIGQPLERAKSHFADEVSADAPIRDLPEGIDKQQLAFVDSLDSVYSIVHEPDLLGGVVRGIMAELSRHPEYRKMIQPKDVRTMIRGMRDSMGMARVKKAETKRGGSGSRSRASTKAIDPEMLSDLEALGNLDLGD